MLELRKKLTGRVQIIGHRGALGRAPENTFPSFEFAVLHGTDILELDIHLSRDDEIVVIHDATLDRTTNGQGYVRDHTLAELKCLDAGSKFGEEFTGTQIPTLAELLDWSQGRAALAIEIKADYVRYNQIEEKLLNLLTQYNALQNIFVISFDHTTLRKIKQLEPEITVGPLFRARLVDPVRLMQDTGGTVMRPFWAGVTDKEVDLAHENGWALAPWGANEPWMWEHLWNLGVDAMSANCPDNLATALAEFPRRGQD